MMSDNRASSGALRARGAGSAGCQPEPSEPRSAGTARAAGLSAGERHRVTPEGPSTQTARRFGRALCCTGAAGIDWRAGGVVRFICVQTAQGSQLCTRWVVAAPPPCQGGQGHTAQRSAPTEVGEELWSSQALPQCWRAALGLR